MKKLALAAFVLFFASSAFAAERPCRAWGHDRHHHRYCRHR